MPEKPRPFKEHSGRSGHSKASRSIHGLSRISRNLRTRKKIPIQFTAENEPVNTDCTAQSPVIINIFLGGT